MLFVLLGFSCLLFFSLAFVCVYCIIYRLAFFLCFSFCLLWYFNIIVRSALLLLFFSRACFVSLFACFSFRLFFRCLLSFFRCVVCDCIRALFGQCRTAKTAPRGTHSRTAARGTPPPGLFCLLDCLCYRCIMFYYARALLAGGYTTARRGYFFGTVCWNKSSKSVLLIPLIPCSRSKTSTRIIPKPIVLTTEHLL